MSQRALSIGQQCPRGLFIGQPHPRGLFIGQPSPRGLSIGQPCPRATENSQRLDSNVIRDMSNIQVLDNLKMYHLNSESEKLSD